MMKNFRGILLASLFLTFNCAYTQIFKAVESIAGLSYFSKNNGVSVADYNGDGYLDFFVVAVDKDVENDPLTYSRLYRNNNDGTFTDVTNESGLINLLPSDGTIEELDEFRALEGFKYGAFWGDYDNDGHPDILFTHRKKFQLFRNQGDGSFVEETNQLGLQSENECENTSAIWFDYNNDGFLDIFIPTWKSCSFNFLYKNNGDGTFTNTSELINIGANNNLPGFNPYPFDFNNDGYLDLYLANDLRKANQLFINKAGDAFEEDAASYGVDTKVDDMGIAISDYNNDGHFDIFITAIQQNVLLTNNGDNTFTDKAFEHGVLQTGWAWGTTFADFDLDGDEDLFITNGYEFGTWGADTNVYYENRYANGQNEFALQESSGLEDFAISVGTVDFDYDNDGDLDLLVTNSDKGSRLYENKTIDNEDSNLQWLKVSLQGTVSNRDAIGAILELTTNGNKLKRYYTGIGFLGQSLKPIHFGLKEGEIINSLKVLWPSGIEEEHMNINPNTHVKITENEKLELLDNQPSTRIYGCTDPNSCNYNQNALVDDGSCEYLSFSNVIEGTNNTGNFKIETYSLILQPSQTVTWKIEGGEILSGQNSETITVKWGFESTGKLSAVVRNTLCASKEINFIVNLSVNEVPTDKSIARIWNEALLEAIRGDYARPTVHARNLFHVSALMYDVWAVYHTVKPYLIGNEINGFSSQFSGFTVNQENFDDDLRKAISYAAYRILSHRFKNSPNKDETLKKFDLLMNQLGFDTSIVSTNYQNGDPVALGNFIAETYIQYGFMDGSREQTSYQNTYYHPVNNPLAPVLPGNPNITDPNRWQSLSLDTYIDQSGNLIEGSSIDFLSPEWGHVSPFAMNDTSVTTYNRDGNDYKVYKDPTPPPYLGAGNPESTEAYKWGFSLVSIWSSHLDPNDGVMWDISPKKIGNIEIENFPIHYNDYPSFYKLLDGGDIGEGYTVNPITGSSYQTQMVPRGDYTRVLAEFWADGPDSETPPGHWFTILNYVSDHPSLEKRYNGKGSILAPLEWDIKSYYVLGGAMHDAAISAWSIKGWYDYIRPISAIRYMADNGQSTSSNLANYSEVGIPLIEGYIEIVDEEDPLAGRENENVGKIKLYAWKGHRYINDTESDSAGVGWILAEDWWPYQRPSFVTPPFAGYISGHSTYSRAAAEVMTLLTGSAYFPDGMGEFVAKRNEFLVFEDGPSVDVKLQWATYRDASDQCSLSRLWGGIHPPADDIPGRLIGEQIGIDAFNFASSYFENNQYQDINTDNMIYPNPNPSGIVYVLNTKNTDTFSLFDLKGSQMEIENVQFNDNKKSTRLKLSNRLSSGLYLLKINNSETKKIIVEFY